MSRFIFDDESAMDLVAGLAATPGYVVVHGETPSFDDVRAFVLDAIDSIPTNVLTPLGLSELDIGVARSGFVNLKRNDDAWIQRKPWEFKPYVAQIEWDCAPVSHNMVHVTPKANVMHWVLPPHYKEPWHVHHQASFMWLIEPSSRTYYYADGTSNSSVPKPKEVDAPKLVCSSGPEWLHAIENTGDAPYRVVRIMLKPKHATKYHAMPDSDCCCQRLCHETTP